MKQVFSVLSRISDGALVTDDEGIVRFWNTPAERLLGFSSTEVIGAPCHKVIQGKFSNGQTLCAPNCPVFCRITKGKGVRNFDIQVMTKSGQLIWLNISSIPVPSSVKKGRFVVAHLFHEIKNLTKIRQLTEKLYEMVGGLPEKHVRKEEENHNVPGNNEIPRSLPLTNREREILQCLAEGNDTKIIANRLCISPITVRNHIQHILGKLGAHSKLEALAIAFRPQTQ